MRKSKTGIKGGMKQGFTAGVIRLLILLLEKVEVAIMVENQELGLMFSRTKEIRAQARASTNHLPEFHPALYRLGKHQVDDFRNVDACVEHINCNSDAYIALGFI